jgi:predicted DCC family thiol-disulfide oxidoreductase YuxK
MSGVWFFDGQCGMCTRFHNFVVGLDSSGRLRSAPLQRAGTAERLGLPAERLLESTWWLGDDGQVHSGAEAINMALSVALGNRLPLLIYRTPGIRTAQNAIYRWVATHRYRFPGTTPYCQSHPVAC